MKKFFSLIFFVLLISQISSQGSLDRYVISSLGYSSSNVEATLGEFAIGFFEGTSVSVHQGFHQNDGGSGSTPVVEIDNNKIEVSTFPNPTYDIINIEIKNPEIDITTYTIHDQSGRLIKRGIISSSSTRFDISDLNSGQYGLLLHGEKTSAFVTWIIKID